MTERAQASPAGGRAGAHGLAYWALVAVGGLLLFAAAAPAASASDVSVSNQELEIEGENDADQITVSTNGTTITVIDTGVGGATTSDLDCTQVNATTVTCPARLPGENPIDDFEVDLFAGVDSFTNQNLRTEFGHVHSNAMGGDDAAPGAKAIVGGPGGQLLDGGLDADSIDGGEGNDTLRDGGGSGAGVTGGNDLLVGGAGTDQTEYFRATPVAVSLDGLANDGGPGEADNVQVENVTGGQGDDMVTGDAGPNVLSGMGGSDIVRGLGGNDELNGEFADGRLSRGISAISGDDVLDGGDGRDSLRCGGGFDLALRDPSDAVSVDCERLGADVVGDNAALRGKKKNKFKAMVRCPESEQSTCSGKLKVTVSGKRIGKGKFSVGAGKTKNGTIKLKKKGVKAVRKAGGRLLVTVEARTTEPGGVSIDTGTLLIYR